MPETNTAEKRPLKEPSGPQREIYPTLAWFKKNWSSLIWYVLSFAVVGAFAFMFRSLNFLLAGFIAMGSIALVTRPIKERKEAIPVFRLGYFFVALVVFLSSYFLLFYKTPIVMGADGQERGAFEYVHPTVAILPGCDYAHPDSRTKEEVTASLQNAANDVSATTLTQYRRSDMPRDAYCGEIPPQWVLNIGGSVLQCHIDGTCNVAGQSEQEPIAETVDLSSANEELRSTEGQLANLESEITAARLKIQQLNILNKAGRKETSTVQYVNALKTKSVEAESLKSTIRSLKAKIDDAVLANTDAENARDIKNNIPGVPIVGGLVVPMYFIVIAVLGGLVNMVRKLPEYQARIHEDYDGEFELAIASGDSPRPPIHFTKVPEYVVFQILQVLSAIAIAILAYSFARPDEIASSVVLAFSAGFSSEVVLMLIRSTVDRLMGLGPRGPRLNKIKEKIKEDRESIIKELSIPSSSMTLGSAIVHIGDSVKLRQDVNLIAAGTIATIVGFSADDKMTVRVGSGAGAQEITKSAHEFFELVEGTPAKLFTLQDEPVG